MSAITQYDQIQCQKVISEGVLCVGPPSDHNPVTDCNTFMQSLVGIRTEGSGNHDINVSRERPICAQGVYQLPSEAGCSQLRFGQGEGKLPVRCQRKNDGVN
jgi:hypothetical protein